MEYYFDFNFLDSITCEDIVEEYVFDDFKYFIEKLSDEKCFIITDEIPSIDVLRQSIFYRLLERTCSSLEYITKEEVELKIVTIPNFKFFFVDKEIKNDQLIEGYGYYTSNSSSLNTIWRKFYSRRSNEDLKRYINKSSHKYSFTKWADLKEFQSPVNTLVISDNYLFETKENVEFNLKELLKNIGLNNLKNKNIDFLVITNGEAIYETKNHKNKLYLNNSQEERFYIAFDHLKNILISILHSDNFNLTFVRLNANTNPSRFDSHSRFCLTNTTFINPHHSFTLFGPKDIVHKNEFIELQSLLWKGPREVVRIGALNFIKKIIQNINNEQVYDKKTSKFVKETRVLIHNQKIHVSIFD